MKGFRLQPNEIFRGSIIEPDGEHRELVVVDRGTRAGAVNATLGAAAQRGWDWQFELLRDEKDEAGTVTELARWSEIAGDSLPPLTRVEPGLVERGVVVTTMLVRSIIEAEGN